MHGALLHGDLGAAGTVQMIVGNYYIVVQIIVFLMWSYSMINCIVFLKA